MPGRVIEPRNEYSCGPEDNCSVQAGQPKPTRWRERKAAVPPTVWQVDGIPPGSEESGAWHHRGNSGTWESHLSPCPRSRKSRGTGGPRALALADSSPLPANRAAGHKRREQTRYRGASGSEATREGQRAVVAEHSTDEGGEVRPKRPTGGKARPGRARSREERREGLRAYQPSEQNPGHRRGVAQLCASGCDELAGYPDRSSGPDTDEPDE
jgi:hypothetical protein